MKFSFVRALVFSLISLPLGFILTALGFAVTQFPIEASAIFPWALSIALLAGCASGFWRSSPQVSDVQRQPSPDKP